MGETPEVDMRSHIVAIRGMETSVSLIFIQADYDTKVPEFLVFCFFYHKEARLSRDQTARQWLIE